MFHISTYSNDFLFISGIISNNLSFTRRELKDIMKNSKLNTFVERYEFMVKEVKRLTNCNEINFVYIKQKLLNFKSDYKSRWQKACRIEETFISNNKNWLDTSLLFSSYAENVKKNVDDHTFHSKIVPNSQKD